MNFASSPQAQARKFVTDFVEAYDKPCGLLVVFYGGHLWAGSAEGSDARLACRQPIDEQERTENTVEWSSIKPILQETLSDVLLIFDCCHAGLLRRQLGRGADLSTPLCFIGACEATMRTRKSGPHSFATALIWALNKLATESKFSATKLVNVLMSYEDFPEHQYPVYFGNQVISINPIRRPITKQPVTKQEGVSTTSLSSPLAETSIPKDNAKASEPAYSSSSSAESYIPKDYGAQSSVGTGQSRVQTSPTGPDTRRTLDISEKMASADSIDEDGASDAGSIRTDGRTYDLPQETKRSLAGEFAERIMENIEPNFFKKLFDISDSNRVLEDLVRDYAILLGAGIRNNVIQEQAVTFIRHQRRVIASDINAAAAAWRPTAEGQATLEEKMASLHFGDPEP